MASIRSKHHSLLNYFLHDRKDLSKAYVRKCEEFIDSLGSNKLEDCFKMEIPKKEQRVGSIPPALKQQAIDESVPYTDIIEANKQHERRKI